MTVFITLDRVPPRPPEAVLVVNPRTPPAYDLGDLRWRYSDDGTLTAFYRYAPRGAAIGEVYFAGDERCR